MCAYRQHYGTMGYNAKLALSEIAERTAVCSHGIAVDEWCEHCAIHCRVVGLQYAPIRSTFGEPIKGSS